LVPGTVDLDVENAMFTILYQVMERIQISSAVPAGVSETLRRCAHDRAKAPT
jgi:hypothetical protein